MFVHKLKVAALSALLLITGVAAEAVPDLPDGPPQMVTKGQKPTPEGGRVVLHSRSRHGNYPLATYSFALGLRGDDAGVANDVELVFGNAQRPNGFRGRRIDSVPGVAGNGACGMDGGADADQFRAGLHGRADHRILDLGKVDFDKPIDPKQQKLGDTHAAVKVDHVYLLRLFDRDDPRYQEPFYIKLRVLRHRDNDAVLVEWKPLSGQAIKDRVGQPGAGGRGGAGGDGEMIPPATAEQVKEFERALTPDQLRLFRERCEIEAKYSRLHQPDTTAEDIRQQEWAYYVRYSAEQRAEYLRELPDSIIHFHRMLDPWYMTKEENAAAAKLPAETARTIERLLSEDVDAYFLARRQLLALGPDCLARIAEAGRKLPADSRLALRLVELMNQFANQEYQDKSLRVLEAAGRKLVQLRAERGEKARVTLLVYRGVAMDGHPRGDWNHFNLLQATHGGNGPTLCFEYGLNYADLHGIGVEIEQLGPVDFAAVQAAPRTLDSKEWVRPVIGHVYLARCRDDQDAIYDFKFRVLELKPHEWVVIEWAPLANPVGQPGKRRSEPEGDNQDQLLSPEQIQALERELTAQQRKLFQESIDLEWAFYQKRGIVGGLTSEQHRRRTWSWFSTMTAEERADRLRDLPRLIVHYSRQLDQWFVSDAEKAAAAKLPPETAQIIEKLLVEDVEVYLRARRQLLPAGIACRALLAEAGRKLPADSLIAPRLIEVISLLEAKLEQEKKLRVLEAASQRLAQLRRERGDKARVALLVSRDIADRVADSPRIDPRRYSCYYSFPKAASGDQPLVSLCFNYHADGKFNATVYGGQRNQIKDLGPVDFASVKTAPKRLDGDEDLLPVVGHVYIEHCLEDDLDQTFKFRVVEVRPLEWMVIEWEPIPREK